MKLAYALWVRCLLVAVVCLAAATANAAPRPASFAELRAQMTEHEIAGAGIKNPRVLDAIRNTPRHEFVPIAQRHMAYFDMALPIGEQQTISPPFIVAFMTEQLDPQPEDRVLEVGTGSGYQAAVLSPLVKEVYTIEIKEPLGRKAAETLKRLGYKNVFARVGDGYEGWPDKAPFDKIIVTCSPENVPQKLVQQLREGGRLIVPLGERYQQSLYLFRKVNGKLEAEALRPTLFVPMTGKAEDERRVKPDPSHPGIINGGFEETYKDGEVEAPKGWHYSRQGNVLTDPKAPEGTHFIRFTNQEAGRGSQALQAFPIDGQKIPKLTVSLRVRGEQIHTGTHPGEVAYLVFTFYDIQQHNLGEIGVGPWVGTFDWQNEEETVKVPPTATHVIVRVGLLGGVGQLDVDDVKIVPAK
ncbi:MAG: protein-L-isoaspartate(D-aspartate) O-methyltransferase [Planctomycetes bacterium]|nr:protein-L-isoaspartate(D-aspartate) O-methyltransferase [Planctomycetota bacterium]